MLNKRINPMWVLGIMLAFVAALGVSSASADSISLSIGNAAISGFPGPYATLGITFVDATHANFVLDSNTVGGNIYLFGGKDILGLQTNGGSATVSNLAGSNSGTGFTNNAGDLTPGTSPQNEDGFGNFNVGISNFDGFGHSVDHLTFTLTNASATPWSSASDVLAPNAQGFEVAGHVFVTAFAADLSNGAIATGFAADGPISTPEASSTLLLSLALIGVAIVARKMAVARV